MIPPHDVFLKLQEHPKAGSAIWPFSVLSLRRNLSGMLYPSQDTSSSREEVTKQLQQALLQISSLSPLSLLDQKALSPVEKTFLKERLFFPSQEFDHHVDFQMMIDPVAKITAFLNLDDHLVLHIFNETNEWHEATEKLFALENSLSEKLSFSFSPRFGYLTSKLSHVGTALRGHLYLHLPLLFKNRSLEDIQALIKPYAAALMFPLSSQGDASNGHLVVMTNIYTVGLSEDHLLKNLYAGAQALINEEKKYRTEAQTSQNPEVKDLIARSFGVLKHSYQMSLPHAIEALSLLKLGVDLGWISQGSEELLNRLFFQIQDGYLQFVQKKACSEDELLRLRAELLHTSLKDVTLSI